MDFSGSVDVHSSLFPLYSPNDKTATHIKRKQSKSGGNPSQKTASILRPLALFSFSSGMGIQTVIPSDK